DYYCMVWHNHAYWVF
nr:immunoglobulin light chain junction region [Macaca mulatta]MOX69040.1 immunoglobulin light chain junction region [Macaca mulatta]MOX69427.1 immunoglobulin light chain junction region [Macaca mulatta]MOX69661.1 immunoglobulin light chain junction region [Macaca mulatta]MOX69808.1 immunoglobulin light chain junction region [Macaca mulatta]